MSDTATVLEALRSIASRLLSRGKTLAEEPESAKMLRHIGATGISPARPPSDFLETLRRSLMAATRASRISGLSRRELQYTPWLLWNGDPPAASLPGLLPVILDQARSSGAILRRLIQAYLRDFSSRAPGIGDAAECIRRQLTNTDPRLEPWRIAQKEVQLFDPAKGPTLLAARLLSEQDSRIILNRYKLDDPMLAVGGYMMAVEDAVRAATPLMLRDHGTKALDRILKVIAPSEGRLRFQSRRTETARAMLGAWLTGRGEPAPILQEPVRRRLLSWLGDPRLRSQSWAAVGEQEAALMRRWLARASLDVFFKLIEEHALEAHWRYRQAFWLAYLQKGIISDAWLALGSRSYDSAEAVRDLGRAYGRLTGPGVTSNQSALLLRVGPLVFAEFSHNGKLRAWPGDWRNAPQLGRQEYERSYLTGKCLPFPLNPSRGVGGAPDGKGLSHIRSHESYWQGSAAALIERHTGIKITALDWQPR